VAARCGSSRFQNGSGGGEDVRRVVVGDFSFGFQPVLDVPAAELCSVESERFATDQRDGFRFHLAQMARSVLTVHELFESRVSEHNVGNFMERGFVRERGYRIYSNFPMPCKPLNVAIDFIKRRTRDVQSAKRRIQVEAGNRRNEGFVALGLCEDKPIGTERRKTRFQVAWSSGWKIRCSVRKLRRRSLSERFVERTGP